MLPMVPTGRSKTQKQIVNFLGLNYGEGWRDGELLSCKNLSSRKFPALTQRGKRETLDGYTAPSALYSWNGLVAVDGTELKIDGEAVATVLPGEKQFAVVNTKLCVFPDKIYIDLTNNEVIPLESSITAFTGTTTTFTTNSVEVHVPGTLGNITVSLEDSWSEPDVTHGERFTKNYIRQYTTVTWNNASKTWTLLGGGKVLAWTDADEGAYVMLKKTTIPTSYLLNTQIEKYMDGEWEVDTAFTSNNDIGLYGKITNITRSERTVVGYAGHIIHYYKTTMEIEVHDANYAEGNLTKTFTVGAPVTITGATTEKNNIVKKTLIGVSNTTLTFAEGTFTAGTQTAQITVSRVFPDFDYVCESQNRLWGVCKADNTIYASALGDPTNFYLFGGTSLDSYAVAVGSEGEWTGICKYDQSVLCFKENILHRVYGDYPAEYSVSERPMFGVRDGAAGSLVSVGGVLYYLGRDGVYAFSGNMPSLVSDALGEKRFSRCYAGSDGEILYMSMKDEAGVWGLYSYDTRKGIWLQEDDTFALSLANVDGHLYFVNGFEAYTVDDVTFPEGGDALIKCDSVTSTEKVEWEAEFTPFDETTLRRKSPSKLSFRCELEASSWVSAYISCDGEAYRLLYTSSDADEPTIVIPVAPRRCDSYKVKLVGKGGCVIRAAERTFRVGSDWR